MSCLKFLNVLATGFFSFKYFLNVPGGVSERLDITVFEMLITALVNRKKTSRLLVNIY